VDLKTRRRGAELETAILDAAWEQLLQGGYRDFTFESVAARAGTSRPVLYRRWADRADLLQATIRNSNGRNPIVVPDTGDLRADVIELLTRFSAARAGFAAVLSAQLAEYFHETGTSLADLRSVLRSGPRSGIQQVVDHATERGEIDPAALTERIIELPVTLLRHELLLNLAPVSPQAITEIVDDVWLPLLRAHGALQNGA
jgi:AcrR family transcriptional regulator